MNFRQVFSDAKTGLRVLRRAPGFTVVAVLSLSLGIAASTLIFSLVEAVVLRPLPYPGQDRLVKIWETLPTAASGPVRAPVSYMNLLDWQRETRSFETLGAYNDVPVTLVTGGDPERLTCEYVTPSYFTALGVQPAIGRNFLPEENEIGSQRYVLLIGDGLWRRNFSADPGVVGRAIRLEDRVWTVVGILPPRFRGLSDAAEVWAPMVTQFPPAVINERGNLWLDTVGRLKPGVSIESARSDVAAIAGRLALSFPDANKGHSIQLTGLREGIFGDLRLMVIILLCSVGMLLLIVCTNVANLQLARAETRRREMSVRLALGAGAGRLVSQFTVESMLLVSASCLLGVSIAFFGIRVLTRLQPITLPSFARIEIDLNVAAFVAVFAVVVSVLLGLLSSYHSTREGIAAVLREAGRGSGGLRGRLVRNVLVTAQVALAVTLLVSATLLLQTLHNLRAVQPGYQTASVLTFSMSFPRTGVAGKSAAQRVRDALLPVPGVVAVSTSSNMPLDGDDSATNFWAEGMNQKSDFPRVFTHRVDSWFFPALRIPLKRGRAFTASEVASGAQVAVVSEAIAKRFWAGQDPLGKKIVLDPEQKPPPFEVVGVAPNVLFRGIPNNPDDSFDIFVPLTERNRTFAVVIRTTVNPAGIIQPVRARVRSALPASPVYNVATMEERVWKHTRTFRFAAQLMSFFGAAALFLALVGTYGITAYMVTQRRREFAIQIALGVPRTRLIRSAFSGTARLAVVGIAIGLGTSLLLTKGIALFLYGVAPGDPGTYIAVSLALLVVVIVSSVIPARRTLGIDPATALREE